MLKLGQKVIIVSDQFEQNLPIGDYGYIIAYDRNADNAFDYVIRVPKANRNFYVPAADIELEEVLLKLEAEKIEREALIDFALATYNESLFRRIMNGDVDDQEESGGNEVQSREDFIRQVNLKAWI
ncbi:ATPase [Paenibacillus humicola]|uniref:ATPase n=1 Tax=Paenibacillus humicola TaxID=3110540 RepID=UPI00237BCDBA|nr:ATPase [Paenibacillus humicola]